MAGKRISGLTVAINANTSGVTEGLKDITSDSIRASNNLKQVNALLKLDPENVDLLAERQKLLSSSIETTSRKLEILKSTQAGVNREFQSGNISDAEYIAFQKELVNTEKRLDDLTKSEGDAADASKELGKEVDEASESSKKASDGFSTAAVAVGTFIGNLSLDVLKSAAGALKDLGVEIVNSYGELEQNLGGSEAVFGEYAQAIQKSGEEAYKNLGISQSDYLASANKMGALFQGSGFTIEESLDLTQKAMQRAADAASVMGIDASTAMEAVAGAAKGNFTMMDNLGVAINDTTLKLYAQENGLGELESTQDKVNAAFAMFLEKTEQYDGNFAREATETVSGSMGLLEASVDSLVAGLGNADADIENLTGNVSDSLLAVIDNVVPVIQTAVSSISTVMDGISSAIDSHIDELIETGTAIITSLIEGIMDALPTIFNIVSNVGLKVVDALIKMLPNIVASGVDIVLNLANGISKAIPTLIPAAVQAVATLVQGISDSLPEIIDAAISLISGLDDGLLAAIPILLEALPNIIDSLLNGLLGSVPKIINAGITLLTSITEALPQIIETIVHVLPQIVTAIADAIMENIPLIVTAGFDLMTALLDALPDIIAQVITAIPLIVAALEQAVTAKFPEMAKCGMDLFTQLSERGDEIRQKIADLIPNIITKIGEAFMDKYEEIQQMGMNIFDNVGTGLKSVIGNAWTWGSDLIANFVSGIRDNIDSIISAAADAAGAIWEYLHFSEPEKGPLSDFSTYAPDMMHTFADGIKENEDVITAQFNSALSGIRMPSVPQSTTTHAGFGTPVINVSVSVGNITGDYDVNRMTDRMIQEMSAGLAQLSSRQAALVGG